MARSRPARSISKAGLELVKYDASFGLQGYKYQ
jgi:hypothetical protein